MSDWRMLHWVALAVGVILCAGATAVCLYVWVLLLRDMFGRQRR